MVTREVVIVNQLGLHARAAARFVRLASQYAATVRVAKGSRELDGKSILGLLLLGAARGTTIVIRTEGGDAEAAADALAALVAEGFGES
ncbi:HPr kinase [Luteitalea sp. TBR-22]|uniref:HPr family phosphocarrier protein n=1 Tax=Luteitalea sp. TBR-22 TaxID=2802971 RepID=UPI001AF792C6|nr:HPr family phosphocarrier protein [Luteitalea sp. TBR-22]BCS33387.1 HPr kinase [Luteitalea sp. TBR-22]